MKYFAHYEELKEVVTNYVQNVLFLDQPESQYEVLVVHCEFKKNIKVYFSKEDCRIVVLLNEVHHKNLAKLLEPFAYYFSGKIFPIVEVKPLSPLMKVRKLAAEY